ncbi:isochorismate synthase [Trichocoleus sp. FACHB-591]|uniref:isochorismate synthase n=1 Tax=Trichocoleus sp. FACHB-591 TaxID=2692872 RepID=UPI001687F69E|nr:isochorismate synthase [Trichocoleus sp. FACHB-591]MBD2095153.1 isochorismate synthase [Trichocoleus sp. FACHB-591]
MPVTPYRTNLFQDRKDLYQFLLACQQVSIEKKCTQIASISLEIDPIDPLAVLHCLSKPIQLSFYFEKRGQDERIGESNRRAIAAIGAVSSLKVEGPQRFAQAQDFIESCLINTIKTGDLSLPLSGPHFFGGFTFFEETPAKEAYFPNSTLFLPRWQVACQANRYVLVANFAINASANLESLLDRAWGDFQKITAIKYRVPEVNFQGRGIFDQRDIIDTKYFKLAVLSALEAIESKQFNKIVLAHAIDVISPTLFHVIHSLSNLRRFYPDCYVFCLSNGKGQNFIGASPERLLSIQDQELLTDALAGSFPRGKTALEDANLARGLLNSEKEIREHQVVIDFLTQSLSRLGLMPRRSLSPHLLQLSNIQHLRTPIRATVPADVSLLQILAELHPTPAVAGAPRDIACQRIRSYEAFERSLYAAPLGWLDHKGNGEFIVGIRSALVNGCSARLYAGAGIVAGSDPEKELTEIKLKLQALLQALV